MIKEKVNSFIKAAKKRKKLTAAAVILIVLVAAAAARGGKEKSMPADDGRPGDEQCRNGKSGGSGDRQS